MNVTILTQGAVLYPSYIHSLIQQFVGYTGVARNSSISVRQSV
jgi:hypothetical protein